MRPPTLIPPPPLIIIIMQRHRHIYPHAMAAWTNYSPCWGGADFSPAQLLFYLSKYSEHEYYSVIYLDGGY